MQVRFPCLSFFFLFRCTRFHDSFSPSMFLFLSLLHYAKRYSYFSFSLSAAASMLLSSMQYCYCYLSSIIHTNTYTVRYFLFVPHFPSSIRVFSLPFFRASIHVVYFYPFPAPYDCTTFIFPLGCFPVIAYIFFFVFPCKSFFPYLFFSFSFDCFPISR